MVVLYLRLIIINHKLKHACHNYDKYVIINLGCENMDVNVVIKYLKNSNIETEKTLINGFVNDVTVKYLPLYVFETFALNKEAQEIIIQLPEQHLKNISKIIYYSEGMNEDWIPLCASYYHFLKNKRYSNLINEVSNCELDKMQIEKLLFVINNGGNYFDINSIDDLNNISTIRNDKNEKNETRDPNILLLNKYGISYDKAYSLYVRYGKEVKDLPQSQEKDFLLDIKNIIEGKGTEKSVFEDLSFIINIDSILRNFYSKIYDDCFYYPTEDKKIGIIDNIEIYDAGVDFNMSIYSYGMATKYATPENFKTDWNRPSISTDYICNSIINSCSIKTHVKHCLFGFRNFGRNNLSLLGANDLGTGGVYRELNVTNPFHQKKLIADVEFRTPDSLINNTRFTNNEVYRSRRRIVNSKLERINPDYIVYLKTKENYSEDPIWIESLKAAKDFNIPIVMIDCERCLLTNIERIEQNLKLFESRFDDSKLLTTIVESIYTINSGYRDIAPELLEKDFNRDKVVSYLGRIIMHIDEISITAPKTALECTNIILNTLNNEFEKVLKSPYWVDYARKQGYTVEKPQDIIDVFENKKIELEKSIGYHDNITKKVN